MRQPLRAALILSYAMFVPLAWAGSPDHSHDKQPICHSASECPLNAHGQAMPHNQSSQRPNHWHAVPSAQPYIPPMPVHTAHRHVTVTPGYFVNLPANIQMINAPHHLASGASFEKGVRVYRPAENANLANAAALSRQQQARRNQKAAQDKADREDLKRSLALQVSLDAIEANQQALLAQSKSNRGSPTFSHPSKRRTYYGNPPFFGRNGFVGNRNFSGASIQIDRRRKRAGKKPAPKAP